MVPPTKGMDMAAGTNGKIRRVRYGILRLALPALAMMAGCRDPDTTRPVPTQPFRLNDERIGPRLEAAWRIADKAEREKAIRAVAEDAAAAGVFEVVRKAIEGLGEPAKTQTIRACILKTAARGDAAPTHELLKIMPDGPERDSLAAEVADQLADAGEVRAALDIADLIADHRLRDQVLLRLSDRSSEGLTSLAKYAKQGREDLVRVALEQGSDVHARNRQGNTALIYAAKGGHVGIVKLLLQKGAHPDTKNHDGTTALMAAAEAGHLDCVKVLLDSGAAPFAHDNNERTAADLADAAGKKDIAQYLRRRAGN